MNSVRAPDGTRLAVYEWGNAAGPEVLLIHGIAQCHLCFEPQYRSACMEAGARYFLDKSSEFERVPELVAGLAPQQ